MKTIFIPLLVTTTILIAQNDSNSTDANLPIIMALNKLTGLNIGKKTNVNITLYAKNPSTICSLRIKNTYNPYNKDITKDKFKTINLQAGHYILKELKDILKGKYEFEYSWYKNGRLIDSSLKDIRIFEYHNNKHKFYKKLLFTQKLKIISDCK